MYQQRILSCVCEREPPAHFVYLVPERIARARSAAEFSRFLWLIGSRHLQHRHHNGTQNSATSSARSRTSHP